MPTIKAMITGILATTGVALGVLVGPSAASPTAQSPAAQLTAPAAAGPVQAPAQPRAIQGCAIRPYKVSKRGPIKGKVTAKDCSGWLVWYGMQVHRWHGWTRIAGKDAFVGDSGKKTYWVKACKLGTFNYRMYISKRGGLPPAVIHTNSGSVRRKC